MSYFNCEEVFGKKNIELHLHLAMIRRGRGQLIKIYIYLVLNHSSIKVFIKLCLWLHGPSGFLHVP